MALKPSEKISADFYCRYLHNRGIHASWRKGDDPPDLIFELKDLTQAIEVTELHKYIEDNERQIEQLTAFCHIDDICSKAKAELGKDLNRTITVSVTIPLSSQERARLSTKIISYSRQNIHEKVYLFGKTNCWISSENGDPDIFAIIAFSGSARTPRTEITNADVQTNLRQAMDRILCAKFPRIEQLNNFDQRILIIFSEHPFGDLTRVQIAIEGFKPIPRYVDEIYLIKNETFDPLNVHD